VRDRIAERELTHSGRIDVAQAATGSKEAPHRTWEQLCERHRLHKGWLAQSLQQHSKGEGQVTTEHYLYLSLSTSPHGTFSNGHNKEPGLVSGMLVTEPHVFMDTRNLVEY
jgi:hypothetical protein